MGSLAVRNLILGKQNQPGDLLVQEVHRPKAHGQLDFEESAQAQQRICLALARRHA